MDRQRQVRHGAGWCKSRSHNDNRMRTLTSDRNSRVIEGRIVFFLRGNLTKALLSCELKSSNNIKISDSNIRRCLRVTLSFTTMADTAFKARLARIAALAVVLSRFETSAGFHAAVRYTRHGIATKSIASILSVDQRVILSSVAMVIVSQLDYSIYSFYMTLGSLGELNFHSTFDIDLIVGLPMTFVVSCAVYILVEEPIARIRRSSAGEKASSKSY